MADERLLAAAQLLQQHYGRLDLDAYRSDWSGLVQFLLERLLPAKKFARSWPDLKDTWLMSVEEVAQSSRSALFEFLEPHGVSATSVALLHRLAVWWQQELDAGRTPVEEGRFSLEAHWERLSAHDPIWITRIFCVIGGLKQFPLTRGVWRVGCRHQWFSWHDDPSEAPAFFESTNDSEIDLPQLAEWLIRVGEEYCGPKAKCNDCPLQPLLGPSGPCEPEE